MERQTRYLSDNIQIAVTQYLNGKLSFSCIFLILQLTNVSLPHTLNSLMI